MAILPPVGQCRMLVDNSKIIPLIPPPVVCSIYRLADRVTVGNRLITTIWAVTEATRAGIDPP